MRIARVALVGLSGVTLGCATVPAPISSPEPPSAHGFGMTFSSDWGFARATLRRPDGTTQVITGNGDDSWGESSLGTTGLAMFVPAVASYHVYLERGDGALFAGWRQVGLTSRLMLAGRPEGLLSSLILTGKASWDGGGDVGAGYELLLPVGHGGARLVARVGASWGRRAYDVGMPTDLEAPPLPASIGASHLKLFRDDARVETALGIMSGRGHFTVSVQPYWVFAHDGVQDVSCVSCADGVSLQSFTLKTGFALALTLM